MIKLITALLLFAASPYSFRHFTTRDGLSSNNVRALVQDHRGIVWMGTSDGLDSFDGREVIHHTLPGSSEDIQSLFEDASHNLWIGTDDAVYLWQENALQLPGFPAAVVTEFTQTRDGSVWIGTYERGVWRYQNGKLTPYLDGHSIEALHVALDGRLWVADNATGSGLLVFNAASDSFTDPAFTFYKCTPTRVCAIEEDSNGNLWLGTWDSGLYCAEPASQSVRQAVAPGEGLTHVHSLLQVSAWTFLVGSDDGLLRINPFTGERTHFSNDRTDPLSLSNKFVYPILTDREGGLWVGTYYGGVNYVAPGSGQFYSLSLSQRLNEGENYVVSSFCEDRDGTLWIGSDNGGLFRYTPATQSLERTRFRDYNIHALLRQGNYLWIGTYADNLLRLNLRTRQVKVYGEADGLDARSIFALYEAPDGAIWAGTNTGLCRYDAASDRFTLEHTAGWVNDIQTGPGGSLWAATARSGILFRSPEGRWEAFTRDNTALPSNYINCLFPGANGIYAGTQKGLVLLSGGQALTLLPGMNIQDIAYDGTRLWLTTPASLLRYDLSDGQTEQYGDNDGVRATMFSPNSGLVTQDGRIYLGTQDGLLSFFPGSIQESGVPPTVLFTRIVASSPDQTRNLLAEGGDRLPWNMRDLYLTFAAPSFNAPEKIRYSYLLEGLDSHWKELGNQNSLTLNNLPGGHYKLHLKATNTSGQWNREETVFSFSIRKHPLLSNIALILYTMLISILILLLLRYFVRRMERRSKRQYQEKLDEALSHVKEEERDDRVQLLSSLGDQLEAPVTGIGVQVHHLKQKKETEGLKQELTALEKNQRMLRSILGNLRQMQGKLSRVQESENGMVPPPQLSDDFLSRLDQLITENMANPDLSVGFLAKEMAISRSSLFAKTKELTGETPNTLINQTRLNVAANLLSEGKLSVSEICYMVGFSSPSYFSKVFTAQFGVTPHQWAKNNVE